MTVAAAAAPGSGTSSSIAIVSPVQNPYTFVPVTAMMFVPMVNGMSAIDHARDTGATSDPLTPDVDVFSHHIVPPAAIPLLFVPAMVAVANGKSTQKGVVVMLTTGGATFK